MKFFDLDAGLELNIVWEVLGFSGGPSWRCLGVVFCFGLFRKVLESFVRAFRPPSAQQTEHAKSTLGDHSEHPGTNFLDFGPRKFIGMYCNFGS